MDILGVFRENSAHKQYRGEKIQEVLSSGKMGQISFVALRNPVCQEPLTSDQKLSGVKRQNSPVVVQSCSPTTETKNILQKVKMIGFKCFGLSSTRWVWMWELNPYLRPDRLVAFITHEALLFVFEPHASQHVKVLKPLIHFQFDTCWEWLLHLLSSPIWQCIFILSKNLQWSKPNIKLDQKTWKKYEKIGKGWTKPWCLT